MKQEEILHKFREVENIEIPLHEREEPNIVEINKNSIIQFMEFLLQNVEDGNINPLEAFIMLKAISDVTDKVKKVVDEKALKEAEKYNKNDSFNGFKVSIINGRKTYNFKGIPEIQAKENDLKATQEKYKSAFEGIDKGTTIIENNGWISPDGEVLPLPDISFGKPYIKLDRIK